MLHSTRMLGPTWLRQQAASNMVSNLTVNTPSLSTSSLSPTKLSTSPNSISSLKTTTIELDL